MHRLKGRKVSPRCIVPTGHARDRRSRALASGCAAALLVLSLLGCGGSASESEAGTQPQPQGAEVVGADGASVSLMLGQPGATVRVARDATGAPPLDASQQRAGAVYQFSPSGLAVGDAEIRVPFDVARAGGVHLAVAQPGGLWSVVPEARQEGSFLVARVSQLSYAVVLHDDAAQASSSGEDRAQTAAAPRPRLTVKPTTPITQTVPPWQLLAVRQAQTLGFDVELAHAKACAGSYTIELQALVIGASSNAANLFGAVRFVSLGERSLAGTQGTVSFERPFSSADNGSWFFGATAVCRRSAALPSAVAYVAVAPSGYDVGIAAGELPVIGTQPTDVSVIEGDTASFSASATGSTNLQWERSNDGGASYSAVPGAAGQSIALPTTTLADNGALLRLRAGNANGNVFSNAARLNVAERVVAPSISVEPADQSVLEGETASFSVVGSGKPLPTVQWQKRAGAAGAWADIPGATAGTYTTPPLSLADSGAQVRALLANRGGQAESRVATLTVRPRTIAPAITTGPQNATVPVGTRASFSVTATGTAPLSYRWLRNGSASGISDLGSSAFVDVVAADLGQPITVTVEVSNSAGTASASATLTAAPATTGAAVPQGGGTVTSPDNRVQLTFPAGALTADSRVTFTPIAPFALPAAPAFEDAALISGTTYRVDITGGTLNGNVPLRFKIVPPSAAAAAAGARSFKAATARPLDASPTDPQTSVLSCPDGTIVILNDASGEVSYDSGTGLQCSQGGASQVQIGLGLVVSPATRVSYATAATGNQKVLYGLGGTAGRMSYLYESDPTPSDPTTIRNYGVAVVLSNGTIAKVRLASAGAFDPPPQLLAFDGVGGLIVREVRLQTASPFLVTTCTVSKYVAVMGAQFGGFARSWSVPCPVLARVPRAIGFAETNLLRVDASTNGAEVVLASGDGYLDWMSFTNGTMLRAALPLRPRPTSQVGISPAFNLVDMVIDAAGAVWFAEFGSSLDMANCPTFDQRCVAVSKFDRFGTFIAQNTVATNGYPFRDARYGAQATQARLRLAPAGVTYAYGSAQALPSGSYVAGSVGVVTLAATDARLLSAGAVTGSEGLFVDDLVVDASGQSVVLLDRSAFNPSNIYGKFVARVAANGSLVGITKVPGSGFVSGATVRSPVAIDALGQVSSVYVTPNGTGQIDNFSFPVWQANVAKFTP